MNTDAQPLDAALFWIGRAFLPVPVRFRSKKPYNPDEPDGTNWQHLRITAESAAHYFDGAPQNIGIILGDDYGSADVDLDCLEAITLAGHFLPDTGMKFGRRSKPASHWIYRIDPPVASDQYIDPVNKKTLVELRCRNKDGTVGHQTVVPPSLHESGEQIRFEPDFDGHPANVEASQLQTVVRTIAGAALLARHWPPVGSGRHQTMLALAGVLRRAGWTEEDAIRLCLGVYRTVPDHDHNAIGRTESEVRDTFRNSQSGLATTGIPTLREHLDERVVGRAVEWLTNGGSDGVSSDNTVSVHRLAEAITAKHHFAQDAGGRLYIYRGGCYHADGTSFVRQQVKRLLANMGAAAKWTSHKSEEVVKYIGVDARTLWDRPPLDMINVQNGLLDVNTRHFAPHSPDFLSSVQLPVIFNSQACCPGWDKFISDVFPGDSEAIAWEIVAWLMTPNTSIQRAILLIGDGANGKSTYLRAVLAFVGKHNTSAVSLHKLENDRFSVARLVGRLANICPDLPGTDLTSTSVFKAITGGDALAAEYKFRDSFEFVPHARLVFSANHPPKSQDASPAFFRRWLVVPFERVFAEGAPETIPSDRLDAILSDPAELSGVLNKALEALAAIRRRGLTESDSIKRATDEFRQVTDPIAVWLDRRTALHPDAVTRQDELHGAYCRNCADAGRPTISKTAFGRAMKKLRPTVADYQRTVNGSLTWCYVGISLLAGDRA